jgi:DNA-directed RNA polymerase I, II, and III subunit RPABC1
MSILGNPSEKEIMRLWRVQKTINHMMHDRGYLISQSELDMSLSEFARQFAPNGTVDRKSMMFLVQKKDDPEDQMYVFFPEDYGVGVKPIRTFVEKMVEQGVYKAIIVIRESITPSASRVMATMAPKYTLEQFFETELLVNITEHHLVPQHVPLSAEEKVALLKKYRLKEIQLPRMLVSDPVSRYYGFKRGQVIRIIRTSETAGRYVTYRLVV